ncbi:MAG: CZB domain-containing protein [Ghiorsea sp.]|nr:CZB domain-containing protein [Ghiorsea sp.]
MKLSEAVSQLHNARAAHKAWVARAEALIVGINVNKEHIPMLPTDCIFGQWYYGSGQMLRNLPAYHAIEKSHDDLHRIYMHIFKLLFDEPDVSAWGGLFGQQAKVKAVQLKKAEALLPRLQSISEEVCELLETLEKQLIETATHQSSMK